MQCPNCHQKNPEGEQFCLFCGKQLPQSSDTEEIQIPTVKKWDAFKKKDENTEKIEYPEKYSEKIRNIEPIKTNTETFVPNHSKRKKAIIAFAMIVLASILVFGISKLFRKQPTRAQIGTIVDTNDIPEQTATPLPTPSSNTDEYLLEDSVERRLEEKDLKNLSAKELTLARNEIYARHGMIFKSQELNTYFKQFSWYIANPEYDGTLSDTEIYNAEFILNYQNTHGLLYTPN